MKNVGTPYTVYFGRNLYNTFMNAYTLVDGNVRKKLDETLKTWREPVPGSLSSTPVFRLDITQRIVDALSKARLAAQQNRSHNQSTVLPGSRMAIAHTQPFRNTPTPPQNLLNYGRPLYANPTQPPSRNGFPASYPTSQVCFHFLIYMMMLRFRPVSSAGQSTVFRSTSKCSSLPNATIQCSTFQLRRSGPFAS